MPLGIGGSTSYFDPRSTYGSPYGFDFPTSPVGQRYLEEQQPFAFTRYLEGLGYGGEDTLARFARSQQSRAQAGYGAALATNPTMRFTQYLDQLGPDFFRQRFGMLTPEQRGERQPLYAPRTRWIGR